MATRTATKDRRRRTTLVPVTTMEEIPVLSKRERADLIRSLKAAQVRIKTGKGVPFEPETFSDDLIAAYRKGKR